MNRDSSGDRRVTSPQRHFEPARVAELPRDELRQVIQLLLFAGVGEIEQIQSVAQYDEWLVRLAPLWRARHGRVRLYHEPIDQREADRLNEESAVALATESETATPTPSKPPAGWYPDAENPGGQRYWDGQHWTEHRTPPPPPPEPGQASLRVGYVSCGVIAVGSLGPWATLGPISADGLDGDGVLTLILASIAATLLWRWSGSAARWKLICAIVAGGFATAITLYDTVNISTVLSGAASVGWGLILALIGSIALTAVTVGMLVRDARS